MKNLFLVLFAFVALGFTGCNAVDAIDDVIAPGDPLFEESAGLQLSILETDIINNETSAAPGRSVTATLKITRPADANKPKAIAVFVSNSATENGTKFIDPASEEAELENKTEQTKTITYTLDNDASGVKYIHFYAVNVKGGKNQYSRLTLKVNINSSSLLSTHKNVSLGSNLNALASRVNSATGTTYTSCETNKNLKYIDITYGTTTTGVDMFISNAARPSQGFTMIANSKCPDSTGVSTQVQINNTGGDPTYFVATELTKAQFDSYTDTDINNLAVSNTSPQFVNAAAGKVFAFLTSAQGTAKAKKGLIYVLDLVPGNAGSVKIDIKVQK